MSTTHIVTNLSKRIKQLESQLEFCRESHTQVFPEQTSSSSSGSGSGSPSQFQIEESKTISSVEDVNQLTKDIARFTLGSSEKSSHFGESSNMMLVVTAMDHRKKADSSLPDWSSLLKNIKRPEFWDIPAWIPVPKPTLYNFEFPDENELQDLIGAYFDGHSLYNPILYRPGFDKSIAEGLHFRDGEFGALVLAICALGSRHYYTERITSSSGENYLKSGLKWFDQLPIRQYAFGQEVSLYRMQTYSIAMTYLQNLGTGNDIGWMMNGIAIRLAQEVGAHRHLVTDKTPTIERELWKRVFWTLILFDVKLSMLFGRPRAISSQDFDLELPVECDEEYWENEEDPSQAFVQPPGKPSLTAGWNHFLKLLEIISFSQQALYSVRNSELHIRMGISTLDWQERAVVELDSALNKWVSEVPSHIKWDIQHQDEKFFAQSAVLYSMYYWVQIQVHRRFIPRPGQKSQSNFPSLAICTNAARSCIHVVETCLPHQFITAGHFLLPLFNSAVILAVNLWRGKHMNAICTFNVGNELNDIYKCINLLRLYEPRFTLAGRLVDIINTVMSVNRWPSSPSPAPESYQAAPEVYQTSQNPSRDFLIDQRDLNLPFYSSELGQLPINGPLNLNGGSYAAPHLGYNYDVTDEELAIFDSGDNNQKQSLFQDWDVFMTSMDEMVATVEGAPGRREA
ncbi:Gypsy retrotransposon integrase-like protein 1 [Stygiomarasmius scandens]|uniref:Gypsy retrotransposon integrase-like protein 1 n=1 Tax=Marasmiellus scandens TaxID=2682957 RepID=A0ABR1JC70_9AGAR